MSKEPEENHIVEPPKTKFKQKQFGNSVVIINRKKTTEESKNH